MHILISNFYLLLRQLFFLTKCIIVNQLTYFAIKQLVNNLIYLKKSFALIFYSISRFTDFYDDNMTKQ